MQAGDMNRPGFMSLGLIAGLVVLVADQVSKWWVLNVLDLPDLRQIVLLPVLNLTLVMNPGVTFGLLTGLGAWGHVILVAVALAVVVALGFWLRRAESWTMAVAIGVIAGGAIIRGTFLTSPMRPSFAGSPYWSCSQWYRSGRGKGSARRPDQGRFGSVVAPPIATG